MTEKETIQITPSMLHSTKSVLRNWGSAWIVLMVGLMITASVVLYMKSSVERIAELEFISQCNEISNKISDRLYDHSLLLLSGAALFKASETVTREEWHIFTRHQKIEKTLPGIQGIGFSLLIPRKELTRHIQKIRREGFPHYKLRPDGDRKVYSSIIYLEPFSGRNLQAFGYDMLSEPVRRSAMEQARDTGAAALSGKVILVQETDEAVQAGTLMYMPVYQKGIPIETVEQRRAAIYGWVYSPYRMNDLIHGIFGGFNQEKEKQTHLQVFDGAQPSPESLLYDGYSTGDKKFRPDAQFTRQVPVDFNGQLWTLRFTRTGGGFFTVDYISVWITLVSGIFITLLLFTLTITLLNTVAKKIIEANLTAELHESEEKYRNLFENANEAIFVVQDGKLVFLNPMTAMITGYSAEELMAKPFAEFIHPDDLDMVIDRHIRRMKREELPHVYSFRIIHKDGNIIWGELNAVLISWKGETATLNFLGDITERKQSEEKLKDTLESLRKSFGTIIQVMVSAVETRDPYTAGHQLRVVDIARAIATEMGLSQEKIDGIRMAGSIHDIGKLSVPAEILSKPGKLSAIEFSLIKEHARKGYEMLKDVESPWPLAQIVYQHHERVDGSGYPRNLKGDEILLEARIMAVADVIESMASHRPYRHALGINAALEEIEKNKGILYDAEAVDVCLRLFNEKGYKIFE